MSFIASIRQLYTNKTVVVSENWQQG